MTNLPQLNRLSGNFAGVYDELTDKQNFLWAPTVGATRALAEPRGEGVGARGPRDFGSG